MCLMVRSNGHLVTRRVMAGVICLPCGRRAISLIVDTRGRLQILSHSISKPKLLIVTMARKTISMKRRPVVQFVSREFKFSVTESQMLFCLCGDDTRVFERLIVVVTDGATVDRILAIHLDGCREPNACLRTTDVLSWLWEVGVALKNKADLLSVEETNEERERSHCPKVRESISTFQNGSQELWPEFVPQPILTFFHAM